MPAYRVIPDELVPERVRRDALDLLAWIARDLGVPAPIIRWVGVADAGDADRVAPHRTLGWFDARTPDAIHVFARSATALAIAHEARHHYQRHTGTWHTLTHEELEDDAQAYARDAALRWSRGGAPR